MFESSGLTLKTFFAMVCLAGLLVATSISAVAQQTTTKPEYALVIHAGAGRINKDKIKPSFEKACRAKLNEALETGEAILKAGGSSLDVVEATISLLEDSPLFNAGKGAVFTADGANEMDASIMDGRNLNAGAVAGVKTIKNPIMAARAVMEKSAHVLLAREGAEAFAAESGLEIVDPEYFWTAHRWESYEKAKQSAKEKRESEAEKTNKKHGTVGCVALDTQGNIAAGTSTGGMTMKMWGRVGDSPIIGAGTYADNKTCGVSATGHGEFFIRNVVAYDIAALMKYKNWSLYTAANYVVMEKLQEQAASGGIIGLDHQGNVAMVFNTSGMYRGYLKSTGEKKVAIFKDE